VEKAHHRVRVARAQVEAEVKTKSQKSVYLLYKVTMYRAFLENLFLRVARAQAEAEEENSQKSVPWCIYCIKSLCNGLLRIFENICTCECPSIFIV
jgi:hypothetical protein